MDSVLRMTKSLCFLEVKNLQLSFFFLKFRYSTLEFLFICGTSFLEGIIFPVCICNYANNYYLKLL